MGHPEKSYAQIVKSSVVIGGGSLATIGLGILRTKAMALILGPAGFGLMGVYSSVVEFTRTLAGMGVSTSGVRQIAEEGGTGDRETLARGIRILRLTAMLLGIVGAVLLALTALPVASLTFGSSGNAASVAVLGLAVFFGVVASVQAALLQGLRQITPLAKANVIGAGLGILIAVPVVYFLGRSGIAWALVGVGAGAVVGNWLYTRKIDVIPVKVDWAQGVAGAWRLLRLGAAFMSAGLMLIAVGYLVRILILRRLGEAEVGYYQAAWTLGGLYVGFILQSMGADFFPRLTAVARDDAECNRLVNEQAEVSLLLAGPGILATVVLAPVVIRLFYSPDFTPAIELLRWICLGMALRVASWPMSFILLAKGAQWPYFWSETATNIVQVLLVWFGILALGIKGVGVAFFAGYVFYWVLIYAMVRRLSGFRWSLANLRLLGLYAVLIGATFTATFHIPDVFLIPGGVMIAAVMGFRSLRRLAGYLPPEKFPNWLRKILTAFRLLPA